MAAPGMLLFIYLFTAYLTTLSKIQVYVRPNCTMKKEAVVAKSEVLSRHS